MEKLCFKRTRPRPGDHVWFRVMPWFFQSQTVYEGTVVDVMYPQSKRRKGGLYYHVDTCIGEHSYEGAMVLDNELVAVKRAPLHARKKGISQRRLKVAQEKSNMPT